MWFAGSIMIPVMMHSQPDGETCGPTALHAIYQYYGLNCTLDEVIGRVERTISGGSLAAYLGKDALLRNFSAIIYVNNLNIFDPTWFKRGQDNRELLIEKLTLQLQFKKDPELVQASEAYIQFLSLGGEIKFETLNKQLLKKYFNQSIPILTGLSATYLYKDSRTVYVGSEAFNHDVEGTPCGHFVILCGYDDSHHRVIVADPYEENPLSTDNYYKVNISRLINAIMLGVLTYDANLLIIQPKKDDDANHCGHG
jgi:hypothetical protein